MKTVVAVEDSRCRGRLRAQALRAVEADLIFVVGKLVDWII